MTCQDLRGTRCASRSSVQRPQVYDCLPVLAVLVHDKHTLDLGHTGLA